MPQVILASAEGEHALFVNTLSTIGNADNKHRGSVQIEYPQTMFREWTASQASNDMWVHLLVARNATQTGGTTNQTFCQIADVNSNVMAGWIGDIPASTDEFMFRTRWATSKTSGDTTSGGTQFAFPDLQFVHLDIRLRISTVGAANDTLTVDWYVEQQLRDTQVITDATGWNQPRELLLGALAVQIEIDNLYYQDIIVTDGIPTVGMELVTMQPVSNGFYTAFTNDYTNIDEAGYNNLDLIFATAASQRESFVLATPTFDTSDKIIYAFIFSMVGQTDVGGVVSDFQPFLRISATDYAGTNVGANSLTPEHFINVWTENPDTTAPWVEADFTGLEVGILTV